MKGADRGIARCMTPALSKKAGSKSADGMPWLDFTPKEHEELSAAVVEAQSAGNAEHLTYAERLRQAVRLLEQLDAHAAGKEVPRGMPLPGSPGSPGGPPLPGSPPTVHSSAKESDVEKSMRKAGLALKMGKGVGKAKEVRL